MYQVNNEEENDAADKTASKAMGSTVSGRYVNPYARGDRAIVGGMFPMNLLIFRFKKCFRILQL